MHTVFTLVYTFLGNKLNKRILKNDLVIVKDHLECVSNFIRYLDIKLKFNT